MELKNDFTFLALNLKKISSYSDIKIKKSGISVDFFNKKIMAIHRWMDIVIPYVYENWFLLMLEFFSLE